MRGIIIITTGLMCLLLLVPTVNAQDNFVNGYIIDNNGDTLFGQIHYGNWEKNPDRIKFRIDSLTKEVEYNPRTICAFSVAGDDYMSAGVEIEVSPWNLQNLDNLANYIFTNDTVFLKTLVSGDKSLYLFNNRKDREQYYIRKDNHFELLLFKEYIKNDETTDYKRLKFENSKYKGQLILYMQDCPKTQSIVNDAAYTAKSLTKVFMDYNKCKGNEMNFKKQKSKVSFKWEILAGYSTSKVKMSGPALPESFDPGNSKSTDLSFGMAMDIIFRGNQGKWSIYNELIRSAFQIEGSYTEFNYQDEYTDYQYKLAMDYLKLNNMVRFTYPVKGLAIFGNVGISNGFITKYTNELSKQVYFYGTTTNKTLDFTPEIRKHEVGALVGMGLRFHNVSLNARYEFGDGFSAYDYLRTRVRRFYLFLGYRF